MSSTPSTHLPSRISYSTPVNSSSGERYHYIHPSLPGVPSSSYTPPSSRTNEKLYDVQLKIESVKESLQQGMDKVIARGEKLESLETKAQDLEHGSLKFYNGARNLKCMFCKQNARMVVCIIIALILIIITIVAITQS